MATTEFPQADARFPTWAQISYTPSVPQAAVPIVVPFPQVVYSATDAPQVVTDPAGLAALPASYTSPFPLIAPSTWLPADPVPASDVPFVVTDGSMLTIDPVAGA